MSKVMDDLDDKVKLLAQSFGLEKVKFNEKLSLHTALKLGGPVKLFTVAVSEAEIIKIIEESRTLKVPVLVMGTGSKLVISDNGFNGVVVKNRTQNIKITSIKGSVSKVGVGVESALIEVDSGVILQKFIEFLNHQGLDSSKFQGYTGSLGGNIFTNRSLQEAAESIKVLNLDSEIEIIPTQELSLRKHVVLSIALRIKSKK